MASVDPSECGIFAAVDPKYLKQLLKEAEKRSYEAGRAIIQEGQPGDGMYIVLEGELAVQTSIKEGRKEKKLVIGSISAGSFFGEISLLASLARTATVMSRSKVEAIFLPSDLFRQRLANNELDAYKIAYNISLVLAKRIKSSNELIQKLSKTHQIEHEMEICRKRLLSEPLI